jgi:acetyl-CoA decarbonylase/synthase complex subunit gamma
LREALAERNLWILVLDTKGINVWCAAGKGTFGTEELVSRIHSSGLSQIVSHRLLVLPQLSGPGVAAHQVMKLSGFKVIYGPIRAQDLASFLDGGMKATADMRRQTFGTIERTVLIPVELVGALKTALFIIPGLLFAGGLAGPASFYANALRHGGMAAAALLTAVFSGTVLVPLLLPWLPGRAFSLKGLGTGVVSAALFAALSGSTLANWTGRLECLAWFFMIPGVSAYLAMNFTGCSTYTSLSGVMKETRLALPLEAGAAILGLALWFVSCFTA